MNPIREEERDRLIEEGEGVEVKGNEEESRMEEGLAEAEQKEDGQGQTDGATEQAGQIAKMRKRSRYAWMDCDYLKVDHLDK